MYNVAMNKKAVMILSDIRSEHNVGSIFRIADCAGISKIYLCGYTPTPIDRFNRPSKTIAKTALGAEKTVSWEKIANIENLIKKLKKDGFQIIAVEQSKKSVDYKKVKPKFPIAFIFGNEVDGLSEKTLKLTDIIAEILMQGKKESLNVSISAGIAIFRILNI